MWAHSANDRGARHALADHLRGTAVLARRFAEPFGAGDLAHLLALLHDAGKAACAWQDKLLAVEASGRSVGLNHKQLGAWLAHPRVGLAAGIVLAHHGGLLDLGEVKSTLRQQRDCTAASAGTVSRLRAILPELDDVLEGPSLVPQAWSAQGAERVREMGMRMVFSALVDADHLDTAAHFAGAGSPRVAEPADFAALVARFEEQRSRLLAGRRPSPVDDVRAQVYRGAVAAAAGPTGLYRLPAPTGAGKTLAMAGFALHHAARWGKDRVIVAVPYLTITEQNAQIYRRLLGEGTVLEHHSGVDLDSDEPSRRWERLAAENWDAPFVVTTTVQLFDSLFGRKPARSRKVHRLANAVLVLDEVQALPTRLLPPILDGLRLLSEQFGTTVLLASATQPEFQHLDVLASPPVTIREVVADAAPLYKRMRRVVYEWRTDPRPTLAEVAEEAADHRQALVVVNTTGDARTVYRLLAGRRGEDVRHLSTRMCGGHRRRVLDGVIADLETDQPVLLVSTQLIEAGVDVDFPVVFRALAPADSLQQAAGRANREGRRPDLGRVVIVDPVDGGRPPDYGPPVGVTRRFFGPERKDPDHQATLADYYQHLYTSLGTDHSELTEAIQGSRSKLDFQAVAEGPVVDIGRGAGRDRDLAFRMMPDDAVQLVVDWGDAGTATGLVKDLLSGAVPRRQTLRALQPYLVSLDAHIAHRADVRALCDELLDGLWRWRGPYDPAVGINETELIQFPVV